MVNLAKERVRQGHRISSADNPSARLIGWRDLDLGEDHIMDETALKLETRRLDALYRRLDVAHRSVSACAGYDPAWVALVQVLQEAIAAGLEGWITSIGWPHVKFLLVSPMGRAVLFGIPLPA